MSLLVLTCALKMMMDMRQLLLSGLIMATALSSTVNVVMIGRDSISFSLLPNTFSSNCKMICPKEFQDILQRL